MWDNAPWKPRRWQQEALPVAIDALKAGKKPIISAIMGAGKSVLLAVPACPKSSQDDGPKPGQDGPR